LVLEEERKRKGRRRTGRYEEERKKKNRRKGRYEEERRGGSDQGRRDGRRKWKARGSLVFLHVSEII